MADELDSGSSARKGVWVQVPSSTRPPDELRPIFRIIKETSGDLLKVFFYCTEAIPEPRVQVFAPLRSAQSTRPPDELRPIFRTDVLN